MIEALAKNVVEARRNRANLTQAIDALSAYLAESAQERLDHEETIAAARNNYCTEDIEIDDEPMVSIGDEGVWVAAWVWVPIESEEGESDADDD